MHLISNNCVGSSLYSLKGVRFDHPFVWGAFDLDDFVYIANNYEKINYANAEFGLETRLYQTRRSVVCDIDARVRYHFSHYMQDDSMKEPGRCDTYKYTILYRNAIHLAEEKYRRRVARMCGEPSFLYCFNLISPTSKEYLIILDRLFTIRKKLTVVIHESIDIGNRKIPENVTLLRLPDEKMVICANTVAMELLPMMG